MVTKQKILIGFFAILILISLGFVFQLLWNYAIIIAFPMLGYLNYLQAVGLLAFINIFLYNQLVTKGKS